MLFENNVWAEVILAIGMAWFLYQLNKTFFVMCGGTDNKRSTPIILIKNNTKKEYKKVKK